MEESIVTSNKRISNDLFQQESKTTYLIDKETIPITSKLSDDSNGKSNDYSWSIDFDKDELVVLTDTINSDSVVIDDDLEITSSKTEETLNSENSETLVNNFFQGRNFIPMSEVWTSNEIINSRIISSDNDFVYLDCIVDVETMHFEHRQFHKSLFSNFKTLDTGGLALIKIKSKPGSFRVDVYPGEGMVNAELFDINDDIEELRGRDLGTKLGEW